MSAKLLRCGSAGDAQHVGVGLGNNGQRTPKGVREHDGGQGRDSQ